MMQTSDEGRAKLTLREGKRNKAYKDTKGIWTIGVGHTGLEVHSGLVWTDEQVDEALRNDLKTAEGAVNLYVKVPLEQHQFDALVSFVFNIGVWGFYKSTCLRLLNQGDYGGAAEAMLMWNKPPEIIGRRQTEYKQFKGE